MNVLILYLYIYVSVVFCLEFVGNTGIVRVNEKMSLIQVHFYL